MLIYALCEVLADKPGWRDAGEALLAACDEIDFADLISEATIEARRRRMTQRQALVEEITRRLDAALGGLVARPARQLEAAE